jgi:hypothetical protein
LVELSWSRSSLAGIHGDGHVADCDAVSATVVIYPTWFASHPNVPVPVSRQMIVSRWVDAFNARDLDGILADPAGRVDSHPLRLTGIAASYRGHGGVHEWCSRLRCLRLDHRIVLYERRQAGEGRVLASGSLTLAGDSDIGSFCTLRRFDGELIIAADHYLTDPAMIETLGLIP